MSCLTSILILRPLSSTLFPYTTLFRSPVDPARFAPLADADWARRLARPEIVFAGRADDPRKNIGLLLDAFRRVRSLLPGVRLTLIGKKSPAALPAGAEAIGEVPSVAERLRE